MYRFTLLAVLFVAVGTLPIDDEESGLSVVVGGSIEEYLAQNSEMELIGEMEKIDIESEGRNEWDVFTWGNRVPGK